MGRLGLRALVMGVGLAAGVGLAEAGWVIDQVSRGPGSETQQQVTLSSNRIKTVMLGDGKPQSAVILDLDAQTITQVDYRGQHYMSATVQEFVQLAQGSKHMVDQRMEEAMRDMPPARRRMIEEMMRRRGGAAAGGQGGEACPPPRPVEVKRTDQRDTVAGYPAVRWDVLAEGLPESEVWVAAAITAWREVDRDKLERFASEMAKLAACGPARTPAGILGSDQTWKLAGEGYPVRTVRAGGGGSEVVKAEQRAVPAAEFEPPAGFTRRTLGEPRPR